MSAITLSIPDSSTTKEDRQPKPKRKKISLVTVGSRGDVQPYIILALELMKRGHDVVVVTEKRLSPLVLEFGVPNKQIEGDSTGILYEPQTQKALQTGNFFQLMKLTQAWEKKFDKKAILQSYADALGDADIVVGAGLTLTQSLCMAQANTKKNSTSSPCVFVAMILGPTFPTAEYPLWALSSVPRCLNKWTYNVAFSSLWGQEKTAINTWRTTSPALHNLPPLPAKGKGTIDVITAQQIPVIIAGSVLLCGDKQRVPGDYPGYVRVGGFLFAPPETYEAEAASVLVDAKVVDFLATKTTTASAAADLRPIIYLGFGSMPCTNPISLVQLALDVCDICNCRAVLVAGWSVVDSDPACISLVKKGVETNTLCIAKAVPHGWLFPRVKCIVHHAGVGTMASALRSGVPQVPVPFMLDQPHNAKLLQKLGVASTPVSYSSIKASVLGASITKVLRDDEATGPLHVAARKYAEIVKRESEGNAAKFCEIIEGAAGIKV